MVESVMLVDGLVTSSNAYRARTSLHVAITEGSLLLCHCKEIVDVIILYTTYV